MPGIQLQGHREHPCLQPTRADRAPRKGGLTLCQTRGMIALWYVPKGPARKQEMRVCLQCGKSTEGLFCPGDGMATIVADKRPVSTELQPQTIFAGRYRILGTLGRGGMGAVYDAQHTGTGQRVAIKTLLLDTTQETQSVRRFFMEAKLTASLQHPNTIKVFDFGQSDEGVFFLAMERLQGETLGERLNRYMALGQRMTEGEAAHIAVAVLRSLAEAHRVGLVHRDLKPGNIFVHDLGGGETMVKVLDFGIAKTAETQLTATGTSLGTPAYMSPEQVMGGELDGRSDLYSLGVVLYQCAAGRVPFLGDSSYTVMIKQVHEEPPELGQLAAVSDGFAYVVGRALAKTAGDRFADATAMREALEGLLAGRVEAPSAVGAVRRPLGAANLSTGAAAAVPSTPPPPPPAAKAPGPPRLSPGPAAQPAALPPPPPPPGAFAAPAQPANPAYQTRPAQMAPQGTAIQAEPAPARRPGPQAPAPVPPALPPPARVNSSNRAPLYVIGAVLVLGVAGAAVWQLRGASAEAGAEQTSAGLAANPLALGAVAPPMVADTASGEDADVTEPTDVTEATAEVGAGTTLDVAAPSLAEAAAPDIAVSPDIAAADVPAASGDPLDPLGGPGDDAGKPTAPTKPAEAEGSDEEEPVKPKPKPKPVIKKPPGTRAPGATGGGRAGGASPSSAPGSGRAPR